MLLYRRVNVAEVVMVYTRVTVINYCSVSVLVIGKVTISTRWIIAGIEEIFVVLIIATGEIMKEMVILDMPLMLLMSRIMVLDTLLMVVMKKYDGT